MNSNDDLLCDGQLLVKQVTIEPSIQRHPAWQLVSTSYRKEQHARHRRLRKRDVDETATMSRTDTIIETQLTTTNTEATDEPCNSMTAPDEGVSQI